MYQGDQGDLGLCVFISFILHMSFIHSISFFLAEIHQIVDTECPHLPYLISLMVKGKMV